jgi:hypothetical protein
MRQDVHTVARRLAIEIVLQLLGTLGDTADRMQCRDQHTIAAPRQQFRDAGEVLEQAHAPQANVIDAEETMNQDDRGFEFRNDHGASPLFATLLDSIARDAIAASRMRLVQAEAGL